MNGIHWFQQKNNLGQIRNKDFKNQKGLRNN